MDGRGNEVVTGSVVQRVAACRLQVSNKRWTFAEQNEHPIAEHWQERSSRQPAFFNGKVLVMEPPRIEGGKLSSQLLETDFASYLYWRDLGFPETGVRDGFGSALIRARDGEVLLARQRPGHVNGRLLYMPGGFIDRRDVNGDGTVDIDASVAREIDEETGLEVTEFTRRPGYLVTRLGAQVSIAVELVSPLAADELRALLISNISRQSEPELSDFVIFDAPPNPQGDEVAEFSRLAVEAVFGGF
jgi:8-oxo-dGTP pyrophosphatase MutT (NUDIX family)